MGYRAPDTQHKGGRWGLQLCRINLEHIATPLSALRCVHSDAPAPPPSRARRQRLERYAQATDMLRTLHYYLEQVARRRRRGPAARRGACGCGAPCGAGAAAARLVAAQAVLQDRPAGPVLQSCRTA